MRDLTRKQSVRTRWVKRLNVWTWESSPSRLYMTRQKLLMRMGWHGYFKCLSSWREFFDALDVYRLGLHCTLMCDNLETKEGDEEQGSDESLKEKLWCQRKMWGKGNNAVFEVTKHLKYNFENHKASTHTRMLPVQKSKNNKRRSQMNKNN